MKLFIERVRFFAQFFRLTITFVVASLMFYGIKVISPGVAGVISAISTAILIGFLLFFVYLFIYWFIIEPFFTKKGADRG